MNLNLEGLISIFIGMMTFLMATGKIAVSKNPTKNEEWIKQYGRFLKISSPLIIIFGLLTLFRII